jgi:hypothetical protein
MAKNTFLNPQILPSTRDIRPQDHHKIINGALLAAFVALVIGFAYWWGNKEKEVVPVVPVVTDTSYREEIILRTSQPSEIPVTPAESKGRQEIIKKSDTSSGTSLSAEESAERAAIIQRTNSGN